MVQYKLRTIVNFKSTPERDAKKVMGLTIPNEIAMFFEGCHFTIEKSGTCIIAYSGASINPTPEQIKNFNLNDVRA